ncbi:MAG: DNA repair protein RecO [Lachnospiraceae bacterium]|nr:DNA repair protein RecO [Lachnospiraceae bacterium]
MSDLLEVSGIVLSAFPSSDNDKRVIILTAERGKITAFARGAKRVNSRLMAATNSLCMGQFKVYEGRSAYTLDEVHVTRYFDELRSDFEGAMYGMYFADVADYYCQENNDERDMLNLLYVALCALLKPEIPNRLVQYLYEMKTLVIQGEFPGVTTERELLPATQKAIRYCMQAPLERLFTFTLPDEVIHQLGQECRIYRDRFIGHRFKSLEILEQALL